MAGLASAKLDPESHLLLDQTLLQMPFQLSRRNLKTAQRHVERDSTALTKDLKAATGAAANNPAATLDSLDAMISKMQNLKRKLSGLHEEEVKIHRSSKARIAHLQELYEIPSLMDVKYDAWSRTRLARLLVDYLLRSGYAESAAHLAREKGIEELVDVDAFQLCLRIERGLREGHKIQDALVWCADNKQALKKIGSTLEFELRLQQYIELVRAGCRGNGDGNAEDGGGSAGINPEKLMQALEHARKYLSGSGDMDVLGRAAGLLAFDMDTEIEPYKSFYSPTRWSHLANLFLRTHNSIYSLPPRPLLHIALSAGLSALKTPACHSIYTSVSSNSASATTTVCPICSTELNELAKNVPYAHHSKSIVENDPVVLPNGRIYGRERLREFNEKVGTEEGWVRDPIEGATGEKWREGEVRKVFIS